MTRKKRNKPLELIKKKGAILDEDEEILYDTYQCYDNLDISLYFSGEGMKLDKQKRISTLLNMLNKDERFCRIPYYSFGGCIAYIGWRSTLCIDKKQKNKTRLYVFNDPTGDGNPSYCKYRGVKNIEKFTKKIKGETTAEEIKNGVVGRLWEALLETGKFETREVSRKERKYIEKRANQIEKIENLEKDIVVNLKENGYPYDVIRQLANEPLLGIDKKLIEDIL